MKKVKPPLLRGNKIIAAYIQNDMKLFDSYNFVSTALSKFSTIFQLEELKKGFFPHLFNHPDMWDSVGSIPAEEYYQPDTMHPLKELNSKCGIQSSYKKKYTLIFKKS